ncbi:MAG TPA: hypothetical protein EYG89_00310 [Bacteroidia bacterium]|nr:hypothetical protein [Bacteroidia bacterium]
MHLFIVSERTLAIHLQYGFVGITKRNDFDWINIPANIHSATERSQASMYADISRVHEGDEILLYLEKPLNDTLREGGRFIGVFEITSPQVFYEESGTYLLEELDLPLIYRLQMRPKAIYQNGVTEWQAMDEMSDFKNAYDIPWSIIYRKMTGSRGCTPLLPHESNIIKKMLDLRNGGQILNSLQIKYDTSSFNLITSETPNIDYTGRIENFQNIRTRLLHLMNNTDRKWEIQLQAYLMQELKRNQALTELIFPQTTITWIGNEIYAGAGMQSIDVLVYSESNYNNFIHLIELKSVEANIDAASQINRYIKWLKAHIPNISIHQIIPTIIAPSINTNYDSELKIYLKGHGISQYRNIVVDNALNFTQTIKTV